tara:strand:- start:27327 stop:28694 length:1368 start_codon:yes stop_codon:yes gene_type:complete
MSLELPDIFSCKIGIVGLGYVGLPLAVEFSQQEICQRSGKILDRQVIGFDINNERILELKESFDRTSEISSERLKSSKSLLFTNDPFDLSDCDVFIVTVPTPIDVEKRPDLLALENASSIVGENIKIRLSNNRKSLPIVIFESTVYPSATEDICQPIISERSSCLLYPEHSEDGSYGLGYSPERINPGDTKNTLTKITKVTSGSSPEIATWVDDFYGTIITAGTFKAKSIQVAEACKIIENTQRDLNIALVNELAIIFYKLGINTLDVIEAASSKWNFLPYKPGLVGGHCIGIDPYYLTYKAKLSGYYPDVILAGRRINDGMGFWLAEQLILKMAQSKLQIADADVLILGFSFKENCSDIRNTRVEDVITALNSYGINPTIYDPNVIHSEAKEQYNLDVKNVLDPNKKYHAIILAVAHSIFNEWTLDFWRSLIYPESILFDVKGLIPDVLNPTRI